jgi:hypothetical protein
MKEVNRGAACITNGVRGVRTVYITLDGKSEGKRPLGRLKRRWEDY